ncbi:MAG: DUF5916 domain-containing protein [Ignavibacteriales bacterium]|nr:DUF5916 domain-containing protein [Ignavibacteriales bacterium]
MCTRWIRVVMCLVGGFACLQSQTSTPLPKITADRVRETMTIDGIISEQVWQRPGFTTFTQKLPNEAAPPSQKTEVWLAYDGEALYVAARMHDSSPDSIIQILGRRDAEVTADWFTFSIDPYHDRRSGFFFALSAAGTLRDGTLYNDDWDDNSWDGVWEGRARIDSQGWTAEMRIPFSQLRFHQAEKYVWAVNFSRFVGRANESDFVVYTPQKGSGFVSRFIDVDGIENIDPPRDLEILPYLTSRAEFSQHAYGDPFNNGSKYSPGLGADFKVALGSDLMLNGTVNPDFGQVEVDPAVVNLSDVETFYDEKRPFFIEGANVFQFGQGGSNNFWGFNWGNPNFFYTRRIGRPPQGSLPSHDYIDLPLGTHILGAAKLTGKVAGDWNIGMIHAGTAREYAELQENGVKRNVEIEPLTYYGVGRIQKDFDDGKQGIGFITTYTNRFFSDDRLKDDINANALAIGVDGWQFLDSDKTYVLTGWGAFSNVNGTKSRITAVQKGSRHYFQRPGLSELSLDTTATNMSGYAGRVTLNKQKGAWQLNSAVGLISPGFDVDDLGFIWRTDVINYHLVVGYKWTDRTEYYNNLRLSLAAFESNDFGGNKVWQGYFGTTRIEFPNFYQVGVTYAYNPYTMDTRSTRGGPVMLNPTGWEVDLNFSSDGRKKIVVSAFGFCYIGGGGEQFQTEIDLEYKPAPNIALTIGPGFNRNLNQAQWVGSYADPTATATYGSRYVFAEMDQKTVSANIRLNWTFSPDLSLQVFMQPLISSGAYRNLKQLSHPRTFDFGYFGRDGSTLRPQTDLGGGITGYEVDADGVGPSLPKTLDNPDFNYESLRGNAVLRWEYRPGSALYLVWTQSRSDNENFGEFQFNRSFTRLWSARPDNIFMLKFTYWWSR